MPRLRLLCDTNPMAYGSTASLAAILGALRTDVEVIAMGRDVSLELLRRTALPNGRVVEVDVKSPRDVDASVARERPDAALVIANHANLRTYAQAGVPVFFVDVLFWYGEQKDEDLWRTFEQGFALDFPGVKERVAALGWRRSPTIVGPLLRALPPRATYRQGTLVNLGGIRSVFMTPERARGGLAIVAQILRAVAPALPPGEVVVATGSDAAATLRSQLPASIRVGPLAPEEYDACLQRSALFVTAPGLNAVLEGMAAELPLVFLPPLNASHCLQLRRYQHAGVGAADLDLDGYAALQIPAYVSDEGALTEAVVAALEQVASSASHLDRLTRAVAAQVPLAADQIERRRAFVDALGAPSAPIIADSIAAWWQARPR